MVYGPNIVLDDSLRTFEGGRLRVITSEFGDLLPITDNNDINDVNQIDANEINDVNLFAGGDDKVNESIVSVALHTLFVREHNRLASIIEANNPTWSDDQIFQKARKLVGAEIQAITYNEFLPAYLGPDSQLKKYTGYKSNVNPAISNEFAAAASKIYISGISPELKILDANMDPTTDNNLPYEDALFNSQFVLDNGIDSILRGLTVNQQQKIDVYIIDAVRNHYDDSDLAAQIIQRGRDHGLPSYNAMRRFLNVGEFNDVNSLTTDPNVQANLIDTYGDINDIDPWVGFLAEDANTGNEKLSLKIIREQFEKIRDGDRLWYTIDPNFTDEETEFLESVTLKEIIELNTDVNNLQENIFYTAAAEPNEPNEPNAPNDRLTISLAKLIDNPFWFMDSSFLFIAGGSTDFNSTNVNEADAVLVRMFTDTNSSPLLDESIPFDEFFGQNGSIIFRGPAPVVSLRFTPSRKTFSILVMDPNINTSQRITVDIGIGSYLGRGSARVTTMEGFRRAFFLSGNASRNQSCFFP
ncbi:MAG: hypothetical protein A2Y12_11630 [Planctomycetes bacterium GWF2_42_9]|nr:MAG: hypothetical protein A2Y12_11630 [Planctomycetes bacterium GWF2_42_9]